MLVCNLQCSPQSSSSNSTSSQVEFVEFPIIILGNLLLVDMDGLGPVVLTNVTSTTTEPATGCSEFDSLRTEEEWYPQTFSLWQNQHRIFLLPMSGVDKLGICCWRNGSLFLVRSFSACGFALQNSNSKMIAKEGPNEFPKKETTVI